jgi:hypothetical protein
MSEILCYRDTPTIALLEDSIATGEPVCVSLAVTDVEFIGDSV